MESIYKEGTGELTEYGEFIDRQLIFLLPLILKIDSRNEMCDSIVEELLHFAILELLELTKEYPKVNEEELRKKMKNKIIEFASNERKNFNMLGFNVQITTDPIENIIEYVDKFPEEQALRDFILESFQSFSTVERGIILDGLLNECFDQSYIECITSLIMMVKGYYWDSEEFFNIDNNPIRDFIEEVLLSKTMVDSKKLFLRRRDSKK